MSERKKKRMKKKLLAAAVAVTAVLMLGGCGRLTIKTQKDQKQKKAVFILQKMAVFSGSSWNIMKAAVIPKKNF